MDPLGGWHVTSFYRFVPIAADDLSRIQGALRERMVRDGIFGLVVLASEGINGTVSGSATAIDGFKRCILTLLGLDAIRFKDSTAETAPFRRVSVDVRREIVGLKRPDLVPESEEDHHLSPAEWHAWLNSERPPVVIDTRNAYEVGLGKFAGAIDPGLKSFSDWGRYLREADLPREEPVLIYCTGGIRCEKAILEMRAQGYEKVYQLRDGILGYLAEYPDGHYEGECFVFDDRVAVDRDLQPTTRFGICPACGLPASNRQTCSLCAGAYYVCPSCEQGWGPTCSKPCRDRWSKPKRGG